MLIGKKKNFADGFGGGVSEAKGLPAPFIQNEIQVTKQFIVLPEFIPFSVSFHIVEFVKPRRSEDFLRIHSGPQF